MFKKRIFPRELIGKQLFVKQATNPFLEGVCGVVYNETKQQLLVKTSSGQKCLSKAQLLHIVVDKDVSLSGAQLLRRTEERIKG